ncbi:Mu transposase domain-containing protein [Thiorhodovibrio winogradskyi]|uniref:Mu transposase domain-containing protein n=1 Tax=Thiorhodovibrio winogradskyi TaxID=77007 RepID=UPI002E2CD87A|nr:hypothetical protein [Thiorhodovibrio winogradskyi]
MVDNLKSAVLRRITGEAPVFNPRYLDFANHHGFRVIACNKGKGNEKGRVESGVGYVKKNFLNGLDVSDFKTLNPAVRLWMDGIANVREHGETHQRPVDRFAEERSALQAGPQQPYDVANIVQVRASSSFRVRWETNRYSVPAQYAGCLLTLKAYPDRLCVYDGERLIARHPRSWDRHQDFEHPDHPKALLEQRKKARTQKLLGRFLALSPRSEAYYRALAERRLNPEHHVQKIVALSEIYGVEATARAMDDAFTYQAEQPRIRGQCAGEPGAAATRTGGTELDPAPGFAGVGDAGAGFESVSNP